MALALRFERPDQCPDAGGHARPQRSGDYRRIRRHQCPTCGFWSLAEPATTVRHYGPSRVVRVPSPFAVDVVGVSFSDDYPANLLRLERQRLAGVTWELHLVREPANPYDANAVAVVVAADASPLGHLPGGLAGRLGPAMDAGQSWTVTGWRVVVDPHHPDHPGLSLDVALRAAAMSHPTATLGRAS